MTIAHEVHLVDSEFCVILSSLHFEGAVLLAALSSRQLFNVNGKNTVYCDTAPDQKPPFNVYSPPINVPALAWPAMAR